MEKKSSILINTYTEPEMCKLEWFLRFSSPLTLPDAHKICENTSFLHIFEILLSIIQTVCNQPKHLPQTEEARKFWTLEFFFNRFNTILTITYLSYLQNSIYITYNAKYTKYTKLPIHALLYNTVLRETT